MKYDIEVAIKSIYRIDTIITTMTHRLKNATEIDIQTTTNIDMKQGSLPASKKIEKCTVSKGRKIPAQSRQRVQQLLPIAAARVL